MIRNAKHSSSDHFSHSSWKINAILREITFTAGKSCLLFVCCICKDLPKKGNMIVTHKKGKEKANGALNVAMQWQNLGWWFHTHIIDAFLRLVYHIIPVAFPTCHGELPKEKLQKLAQLTRKVMKYSKKDDTHKELPTAAHTFSTRAILPFSILWLEPIAK